MIYKYLIRIIVVVSIFNTSIAKCQVTPTNNTIAVDITLPQNGSYTYDSAFVNSYTLGMRQVGLHFLWKTSLEPTPESYNLSMLDIANIYYPYFNVSVDLNIDPIETNVLELPSDLVAYKFNDSVVIKRFKILLDSVFKHIPNLQLSSLVIGSEIDAYLGNDSVKWGEYTAFYSEVSAYAKSLRPGLKIACEAMFSGFTQPSSKYLETLNSHSDYIGVSYYPLQPNFTVKPTETVATDFATIVNLYPAKPIFFYQIGYPSSTLCNSSEALQAQFVAQVFNSWDVYADNIQMIDFTWLHDWSDASVNIWSNYYGISDSAFLGFLGSIGLRNWDGNGSDKLAYSELKCQAKQRGFNSLPINCLDNITKLKENEIEVVTIFPNPVNEPSFNIEIPFDVIDAEIKIYNPMGEIEKVISNVNTQKVNIGTHGLANGIYAITIQDRNKKASGRFILQK